MIVICHMPISIGTWVFFFFQSVIKRKWIFFPSCVLRWKRTGTLKPHWFSLHVAAVKSAQIHLSYIHFMHSITVHWAPRPWTVCIISPLKILNHLPYFNCFFLKPVFLIYTWAPSTVLWIFNEAILPHVYIYKILQNILIHRVTQMITHFSYVLFSVWWSKIRASVAILGTHPQTVCWEFDPKKITRTSILLMIHLPDNDRVLVWYVSCPHQSQDGTRFSLS